MTDVNIDELRRWIGRRESRVELIHPVPARLLAATLDEASPEIQDGADLPPLYHWLYFLPTGRLSELGNDGHLALGGFLPPIPLPRRMWASSSIEFIHPVKMGDLASRTSEIVDVALKRGRSGSLVFVKLRHTISCGGARVAIREVQELVYRDHPRPEDVAPPAANAPPAVEAPPAVAGPPTAEAPPAANAPPAPTSQWDVRPTSVLLFRYSALTFNSHRIHYDRDYATSTEGYPGLVVHGPLVATLLVTHLLREVPGAKLKEFKFRALRPLFDHESFTVCCQRQGARNEFRLWSRDCRGATCTDASATIG